MFCPRCGREDEELYKGICRSCFVKEAQLIKIPHNIEITICAHCNSLLKGIKWEDSELSEEELVKRAVKENIEKFSHVNNLDLSVQILTVKGTNFECIIYANGNVIGTNISEDHRINVKIKRGMCPDCSRYASGYFESVIQIRADKRFPSSKELQTIDNIIRTKTRTLSVKNRMAYISNVAIIKEGVDYYIGSYKAAKKLSSSIKDSMGGIIQESPRLVGRDKFRGKDLYRIWISIRLPNFQQGDFIKYEDHIGQVKGFDGKKIILKDIISDNIWSIMWKEYNRIKVIARNSDIKITSIISKSPKIIQILHPETYQPIDIEVNDKISDLEIGNEIKILEIEGVPYILGKL
ncbi:MAG: NMD3-related protein [Methanobacterium sp.]|nr:NMD3-related protein [Methanobacterium sp.]